MICDLGTTHEYSASIKFSKCIQKVRDWWIEFPIFIEYEIIYYAWDVEYKRIDFPFDEFGIILNFWFVECKIHSFAGPEFSIGSRGIAQQRIENHVGRRALTSPSACYPLDPYPDSPQYSILLISAVATIQNYFRAFD